MSTADPAKRTTAKTSIAVSTQFVITSTKNKFRDRSLAYLTMYISWTNERLWITDDQNSQRQESFNNTDDHGPLAASCQLVNTWVLGLILEVPLFTSDSYAETTFGLETGDEMLRNLQGSFTVHTRRIHEP